MLDTLVSAVVMLDNSRRDFMKAVGVATVASSVGAGSASAGGHDRDSGKTATGRLDLVGHSLLSDPPGAYSHGNIRDDGQYGLLGGYYGEGGSFLVDLDDLNDPTEVHRLPSPTTDRQNDVKFARYPDGDNGDELTEVYFRTQEPNIEGGAAGFEVVDYGWGDGTPEEPEIVAQVDREPAGVHKVASHGSEPVLYVINKVGDEPGLEVFDVSDPSNPTEKAVVGPDGYNHAVEVDDERNLLYAAFIAGEFVGPVIYDISDPLDPKEVGRVDYDELPDYETIGEPGFEACHHADADPERDLLIVGDEVGQGVPGGKHVFDMGWDEGSPEDPVHIGFTHSPNAEYQGEDEPFFWTTHFHDVVSRDDHTLLVDGGYHEGVWVADITDPRDPEPSQQFGTRQDEERVEALGTGPIASFLDPLHPPFVWSAEYNADRDFVLASDAITGVYILKVTAEEFEFRSIEEEIRRSYPPADEIGERGLELARHYHDEHETVPNTGGEILRTGELRRFERIVEEEQGDEDEDEGDEDDEDEHDHDD